MTHSTEWANVQGGEQMELATVISHKPRAPLIAAEDILGIRIAKLLRQYDESPSSALWSEIQSVAREVLR